MTQTIILAHYINTAGKSREEAIEEYHQTKHSIELLNAKYNDYLNSDIVTYVILSETKPTSIECVYPVVSVASDEDYIELIKRLDAIVDSQKSLVDSCK